jgi:hypothetical protein
VIDESRGESEQRRRTVGRPNRIADTRPQEPHVSLVPRWHTHHPGTADGTEKPLLPQMPLLFCST